MQALKVGVAHMILEQSGIPLSKLSLEVSWDVQPVEENAVAGVVHQIS